MRRLAAALALYGAAMATAAVIVGTEEIDTAFLGTAEIDSIYLGERLLFTRPALPQITTLTLSRNWDRGGDSSQGNLALTYAASAGSTISLRDLAGAGRNIPLTGSPTYFAPPAASTTLRFNASNAEGATHQDIRYWRVTAATLTGVSVAYVTDPLTQAVTPYISGTVSSDPFSVEASISPSGTLGFSTENFRRHLEGGGATRSFRMAGLPQPSGSQRQTYVLSVQTRVPTGGRDLVGSPATATVTATW